MGADPADFIRAKRSSEPEPQAKAGHMSAPTSFAVIAKNILPCGGRPHMSPDFWTALSWKILICDPGRSEGFSHEEIEGQRAADVAPSRTLADARGRVAAFAAMAKQEYYSPAAATGVSSDGSVGAAPSASSAAALGALRAMPGATSGSLSTSLSRSRTAAASFCLFHIAA